MVEVWVDWSDYVTHVPPKVGSNLFAMQLKGGGQDPSDPPLQILPYGTLTLTLTFPPFLKGLTKFFAS